MAALLGLAGAAGTVLGPALGIGGKKKLAAQAMPTRDDAAAELARDDRLRKRKGAAADMIVNGTSGAEAAISAARMVVGA